MFKMTFIDGFERSMLAQTVFLRTTCSHLQNHPSLTGNNYYYYAHCLNVIDNSFCFRCWFIWVSDTGGKDLIALWKGTLYLQTWLTLKSSIKIYLLTLGPSKQSYQKPTKWEAWSKTQTQDWRERRRWWAVWWWWWRWFVQWHHIKALQSARCVIMELLFGAFLMFCLWGECYVYKVESPSIWDKTAW